MHFLMRIIRCALYNIILKKYGLSIEKHKFRRIRRFARPFIHRNSPNAPLLFLLSHYKPIVLKREFYIIFFSVAFVKGMRKFRREASVCLCR